jgi:hypothetical protein
VLQSLLQERLDLLRTQDQQREVLQPEQEQVEVQEYRTLIQEGQDLLLHRAELREEAQSALQEVLVRLE